MACGFAVMGLCSASFGLRMRMITRSWNPKASNLVEIIANSFQNRVCSLYTARPHSCKKFNCGLINQFLGNEISCDAAQRIIRETSAHASEVRKSLIEVAGESDACLKDLYFLVKNSGKPAHHRLLLNYVALQLRINKYFIVKPITEALPA
jgi:hypothetical protein